MDHIYSILGIVAVVLAAVIPISNALYKSLKGKYKFPDEVTKAMDWLEENGCDVLAFVEKAAALDGATGTQKKTFVVTKIEDYLTYKKITIPTKVISLIVDYVYLKFASK